jgi:hypothetical protein
MNITTITAPTTLDDSVLYDYQIHISDPVKYWNERQTYFNKNVYISITIGSVPLFVGLIILFLISCIATAIQKQMKRKAFKQRLEKIKHFEQLYSEEYPDQFSLNIRTSRNNSNSNDGDDEYDADEDNMNKNVGNIRRKSSHAYGLNELLIPDENKVPIVLLNEALAPRSHSVEKMSTLLMPETGADEINQRFDPKIVEVINELVNPNTTKVTRPKYYLSDEDSMSHKSKSSTSTTNKSDYQRKSDHRMRKLPSFLFSMDIKSALKSDDERKKNVGHQSSEKKCNERQNFHHERIGPPVPTKKSIITNSLSVSNDEENGKRSRNNSQYGNEPKKTEMVADDQNKMSIQNDSNMSFKKTLNSEPSRNISSIRILVEDYDKINNEVEQAQQGLDQDNTDENEPNENQNNIKDDQI